MNDIFNISSKNSYLTTKQWEEIKEYVKGRKVIQQTPSTEETDDVIEDTPVETQHSDAYEQMIQTTSVDEMYMTLLTIMNESPEKLYEISSDELQALYDAAKQMNEENPSEDYQDLADTLQYLAGEYDLNGAVTYASWDGNSTSGEYTISGTIILKKSIVIPSESTLILTGAGIIKRDSGYTGSLFNVSKNAKLIIGDANSASTSKNLIVIDGNNVIAENSAIYSSGRVELYNTTVCNNKNRLAGGVGGGIRILTDGSLIMNYSAVNYNTAISGGGGIYSQGNMTITNSDIKYNRAMTTETYDGIDAGTKVNYGRGGGFYLVGGRKEGVLTVTPSCVMTNVDVSNNMAMYYGGGCQIGTGASLTLMSGKFDSNEAILHGAGALHITDEATFTLINGIISNNKAHTHGGGIHASYSCVINLNGGEIRNNTSYLRGAGIHINVGGNLLLNGTKVIGNKVYAGGKDRYAAETDETGDNIIDGTIKEKETSVPTGYGGGILIDSGTATMLSGEISSNYAEAGGGGIAFVMIAMGEGSKFGQNRVVSFEMNNGIIENNTCDNNGGAIYLMKNMLSSEEVGEGENYIDGTPTVEINGGIIRNNIAVNNGGAIYQEEKTKFISNTNSDLSHNSAINGGCVYIAQGEVNINGGNISDNISSENGGAIYINGNVTMVDGVLNNNTAQGNGGSVYIVGGDANISSGTIKNNIALDSGGAIAVDAGNVTIGTKECHNAGESSTHFHPVIENNIASSGGGLYVDGGATTMWCGDIKHNKTFEKTVNVLVTNGNFTYNGGSIGVPYDTGVFVTGGVFDDNVSEAEGKIKHELHYHSVLGEETHNGKIPESKWIASPRGDVLHKEDCDSTSSTWGDLFPEHEFVGWESKPENDSAETVHLYAMWDAK